MTLVFDGILPEVGDGTGDIELPLTVPFVHSGENLCIMFIRSTISTRFQNVRFTATESATTANRTIIYKSNTDEFDWTTVTTTINRIANVKIAATTSGEGGKIMGVVTYNGVGLEDTKVSIAPLGVSTMTNAVGAYSFAFLPKNSYTITASKFDFFDAVKTNITPVNNTPTVVDFEIGKLAMYTVSGVVKNPNNVNLEGAEVSITGYKDYAATTDVNGAFTITNVYKANDYNLKITKSGLAPYSEVLNVEDSNITLDIKLKDITNPPLMVAATSSSTKVDISWKEPSESRLFRHDDEMPSGQIGFMNAIYPENSVAGAAYKTPAVLKNMSWWTVNKNGGGPHDKVNVFVFDLDNKGVPTSTVLFSKMGVPNKDDRWSSYTFPTPVECPNGFMVAISYDGKTGYIGLGRDSGKSTEYPFIAGGSYGTINYKIDPFKDVSTNNITANLMMRAEGYEIKESKSLQGYKVWRLAETDQENEAKWTLLTPTAQTTKNFTDNSWATASTGTYKYAVKAVYTGDILSAPYLSNMVSNGMIANVTVNVTTNTTANEATGAIVTLTNNDSNAAHVYTGTVADGKVVIATVWKGVYKVNITLGGFKAIEKTDVDLNAETPSLTYNLEEMTVAPYNLEIVKGNVESECTLNWNKGNIEDDFERHEDFVINSAGANNWRYIDGDKVTTMGLIRGYDFPNMTKPMAYIVFNPSTTTPPISFGQLPNFMPHSGNKYLASFTTEPVTVPNKDFLISPELSFITDFTISFWATGGLSEEKLAHMKVGYSVEGKEQADFTEWLTEDPHQEVSFDKWTKYSYIVPAEAKYLTIECVSFKAGRLCIDDIFIGIEPSKAMAKYEIYLDGEKVAEETSTYHKFAELAKGKHTAGVKAVYTSGATKMSTVEFEVGQTGVDDINKLSLNIYPNPVHDLLNIEGEYQSLEIYNTAGKIVLTANGETQINVNNLSKGVYIIKAHNDDKVGIFKIVK